MKRTLFRNEDGVWNIIGCLKVPSRAQFSCPGFGPREPQPSISWPIDRVFRIGFVIARRPELTALLAAFPRATMLILIMGIAHTKALVLDLTPPAASKRHKGRIATYPLLTTRGFH